MPLSALIRGRLSDEQLNMFEHEILRKAKRGMLNPATAATRANELKLPNVVGEGMTPDDVKNFRSWSLIKALTWVMWQTDRAVAMNSNTYRLKYLAWTTFTSSREPQRLLIPHPILGRYKRFERWTLRSLRALELSDLEQPSLANFVGAPELSFSKAKESLLTRLQTGALIASGKQVLRPRFEILPELWNDVALENLTVKVDGRGSAIFDIKLDAAHVRALWPNEVEVQDHGPKVTEVLEVFRILYPHNEHLRGSMTKKSILAGVHNHLDDKIEKAERHAEQGALPSRQTVERALDVAIRSMPKVPKQV